MDEFNTPAETNWFEVVSSEVRAWWETFNQTQPRTTSPDMIGDQWRWRILQGGGVVPIGEGPGVVEGAGLPSNGGGISLPMLLLGGVLLYVLLKK